MPRITLDTADAAELAETLQLLSDWLAHDPARLSPSLQDFIGHSGYGTAQLRQDLDRFVFLLGGNDGEPLFGS
jgi:hypothetical protein